MKYRIKYRLEDERVTFAEDEKEAKANFWLALPSAQILSIDREPPAPDDQLPLFEEKELFI